MRQRRPNVGKLKGLVEFSPTIPVAETLRQMAVGKKKAP
jgi:hypothetical protein